MERDGTAEPLAVGREVSKEFDSILLHCIAWRFANCVDTQGSG